MNVLVRRVARTCGCATSGQHELFAGLTYMKPSQAGQFDHLDGIGPPPVPYMKKQPSWAGGEASFFWEAIEERLFALKGFKPSKLSRR